MVGRIRIVLLVLLGYELIVLLVLEQDGVSFVPVSCHETRETGSSTRIHAVNF